MKFVAQIVVGSILASLLIMAMNAWVDYGLEKEPASNWMEVTHLSVEPHERGEDAKMLMHRIIKHRFTARWIAEIHKQNEAQNTFSTICWGSGTNDYTPTKSLPEPLLLSWFIGKQCDLPEGKFKLCGTWIMKPKGYPEKVTRACSAIFEVR